MTYFFSTEKNLQASVQTNAQQNADNKTQQSIPYLDFYQHQVEHGIWQVTPNIGINYCYVKHKSPKACIVLFPGRAEAIIKYAELLYELHQNGYSVFALDHQGQGESSRLLANPHMGYVNDFSDYVSDATTCIEKVLLPQLQQQPVMVPLYLLCHSMGSAVGVHFLQNNPIMFQKVCFCAPMLGIKLPLPENIVKWIAASMVWLRKLLGLPIAYFWGQGNYQAYPFHTNRLTNSEVRYAHFRKIMAQFPQNQLGGISFEWLYTAIVAMQAARKYAPKLLMPILVLQAEQEQIVDNQKMSDTVSKIPQAKLLRIPQAQHEILFEKDEARQQALRAILDFLESS